MAINLLWLYGEQTTASWSGSLASNPESLRPSSTKILKASQTTELDQNTSATNLSQYNVGHHMAVVNDQLFSEAYHAPNLSSDNDQEIRTNPENDDCYTALGEAIQESNTKLVTEDLLTWLAKWAPGLDHCLESLRTKCSAKTSTSERDKDCSAEVNQERSTFCEPHKRGNDFPFRVREGQTVCTICNGTIEAQATSVVKHCRKRVGTEYMVLGLLLISFLLLSIAGGVIAVALRLHRKCETATMSSKEAQSRSKDRMQLGNCWKNSEPAGAALIRRSEIEAREHADHAHESRRNQLSGMHVETGQSEPTKIPKTVKFSENT